jgi:Spy/CpxP family protein refolding chaperone
MPGLVALVVLLLAAAPSATQTHPDMWWRNPQVQEALHLTPHQVERLEHIFHQDVELRKARRRKLTQLETQFADALTAGAVSEIEESGLVERMEDLRLSINLRRAMMLMAMYRTLRPEQRAALTSLYPPSRFPRP